MAKKLGNDRLIYIESATPGTFNVIAGQRSYEKSRKAGQIDISDKNNAPYGLQAPGNFDFSLSVDGVLDLPDTNGIERADSLFKSRTSVKFQIRKSPFAVGDVIFEALCYITDLSTSDPKDGESTWKLQLGLAAAPVTDLLG